MTVRLVLVVALVVGAGRAGLALDAVCGLTVPRGQTPVLQADLTCASEPIAITLDRGATLAWSVCALDGP